MTKHRSALLRYGVAAAAVVVATAVKIALDPILGHDSPFLLFFGAVVLAGWYGGAEPAVFATLASVAITVPALVLFAR